METCNCWGSGLPPATKKGVRRASLGGGGGGLGAGGHMWSDASPDSAQLPDPFRSFFLVTEPTHLPPSPLSSFQLGFVFLH